MLAMPISDQRVSSARRSNGQSNIVASIMVVSSTETRSTQSKVSPRGRSSSTLIVRSRIRPSMLARFCGATIGLTTLRWPSWRGGSMRMKLGRSMPLGCSSIWMPPRPASDEYVCQSLSTFMMSL